MRTKGSEGALQRQQADFLTAQGGLAPFMGLLPVFIVSRQRKLLWGRVALSDWSAVSWCPPCLMWGGSWPVRDRMVHDKQKWLTTTDAMELGLFWKYCPTTSECCCCC